MSNEPAHRNSGKSTSKKTGESIWSHHGGAGLALMVEGVPVVRLVGCCGHEGFLAVCRLIPRWRERGGAGLIVDFSGMKWHDLVGVRALVKMLVRTQEEGRIRVCLVRAPLDVRVVLKYTAPDCRIACVSSLRNALDHVSGVRKSRGGGDRAHPREVPSERLRRARVAG